MDAMKERLLDRARKAAKYLAEEKRKKEQELADIKRLNELLDEDPKLREIFDIILRIRPI